MKTCSLAVALLAAASLAVPAVAQTPCGPRADIIKMLSDKYRERPRAIAIANQTSLIEVFTSEAGTWTILVTRPKGATCIIGAGQSWEDIPLGKNLTSL